MVRHAGLPGKLALVVLAPVAHESDRSPALLRDEAGKRQHVDELSPPGLVRATELVLHERLGPGAVGLLVLPDHHGANATSPRRVHSPNEPHDRSLARRGQQLLS